MVAVRDRNWPKSVGEFQGVPLAKTESSRAPTCI
jgi:hypothetical protein